jgi:hypothetical protein
METSIKVEENLDGDIVINFGFGFGDMIQI